MLLSTLSTPRAASSAGILPTLTILTFALASISAYASPTPGLFSFRGRGRLPSASMESAKIMVVSYNGKTEHLPVQSSIILPLKEETDISEASILYGPSNMRCVFWSRTDFMSPFFSTDNPLHLASSVASSDAALTAPAVDTDTDPGPKPRGRRQGKESVEEGGEIYSDGHFVGAAELYCWATNWEDMPLVVIEDVNGNRNFVFLERTETDDHNDFISQNSLRRNGAPVKLKRAAIVYAPRGGDECRVITSRNVLSETFSIGSPLETPLETPLDGATGVICYQYSMLG